MKNVLGQVSSQPVSRIKTELAKFKPIKPNYRIIEARAEHGRGVYEVVCLANLYNPDNFVSGVFGLAEWRLLLERFAEGQLIAVADIDGQEKVVGVALSLRTSYDPTEKPLPWEKVIGDLTLANHDSQGCWLYGVEKAVHPDFQGMGIGSALYKAQFNLVKRLGLCGIYAGGMLKGYKQHKREMSVREYADKVMRGELFDPTVSVQMRKGFRPVGVIENYAWDAQAAHTGMLIVWEAPKSKKVSSAKPSVRSARL